ncbi:Crp/Fnr family transcriptional regulator [Uliginosibacterium aquaticum]|uniref:Crp/Fnr family transcriptional regulator n=1 Tax=Uliginosibacterium aquaticum TaxID=2731212 RepID=A0ABX2IH73_9RHOO|nr:Crp/Fnr family transcriptional regulator [Uliginosibacterium aquaticum]NSL56164.1 Crp/Fnr family transcriptional regulator [Uliginosibacterium aquaticum]
MEKQLKADVRGLLGRLPMFAAVDGEALDRIAASVTEHRLARGDVLFRQNSPCTGFYVVVHGQMKLAVTAPNGNEKVLEIIPAHMSFGEAVMFLGRPFPVTAEALTDSLILGVPRDPVQDLIDSDKLFARKMLAGLSLRLHSLVKDVEGYALRSSTQRLIGYLLREAGDDAADPVEIDLPTSKQVLASRLSVTPETFSRILHNLSADGLVEVDGKTIRVANLARLRDHEA